MAANISDTDVIIDTKDVAVPECAHGPALMFVRYSGSDSGRRFFACSAFRDRKDCSFFQWCDEKVSQEKLEVRKMINKSMEPKFSHKQYRKRLQSFKRLQQKERQLCRTCGLFLLPDEKKEHKGHDVLNNVSKAMLRLPSQLFIPLDNNKTYAQYLFSKKTVAFVLDQLKNLNKTHVICLGAPRIHEAIMNEESGTLKSYLLDLDYRYMQLYGSNNFSRYNMFNHHFFDGEESINSFTKFLTGCSHDQVTMVFDPPFGGMVEALSVSIRKISELWKSVTQAPSDLTVSILWFFPYFMEKRILDSFKDFQMLDYKVDYDNHTLFRGDVKKHGSPVRIFTNIHPQQISLSPEEGYWFCSVCKRYSAKENIHCDVCDSCPTKYGATYRHCFKCDRCIKPSKEHCDVCRSCQLRGHMCDKPSQGCHICGALDHKRRECPEKGPQKAIKRKKKWMENGSKKKIKC